MSLKSGAVEVGANGLTCEVPRPHQERIRGNKFREWCNEAGLPRYSAHGLRHARRGERATDHQLMAIFGWKSIQEAERYTKAANVATALQGKPSRCAWARASTPSSGYVISGTDRPIDSFLGLATPLLGGFLGGLEDVRQYPAHLLANTCSQVGKDLSALR